ncbi:MAG: polymer-forming cytoskeletal protein [Proteobacteria bacterium]|nr:polymer-forming cytoskeletal protein [Pseudomonadota bacterium]
MENEKLSQSELTLIGSDLVIEGKVEVRHELHLFGKVIGEVRGLEGSVVILKEGSLVEGRIMADSLIVDGFVKGEVEATRKVRVTSSGTLAGSVKTPSLEVDPGAVFEARVSM